MVAKVAPVATWVASWLITTCAPRSLSLPKTVGFTKTRTGASEDREPSTVVVTAAMLAYSPGSACSAESSCLARARDLHEQGAAPVRQHASHLAYGAAP